MKPILLFWILTKFTFARIYQDDLPSQLDECYSKHLPQTVDQQNNCLESYLIQVYGNISNIGIHRTAVDWIDSLGRNINRRLRRQSGKRRLRVRKELRTLSDDEIEDYFDAIKALKKDTDEFIADDIRKEEHCFAKSYDLSFRYDRAVVRFSEWGCEQSVKPNKYDAFALTHQGLSIESAHKGPNFLGWHRYLLVLYEDALRTKKRGLTLPYWDSTPDFLMNKPEDTVMFSEVLVGNGKGVVYNGPFAFWMTPDRTFLRRNVPGERSSLINPDRIKNVFTKRYHREILTPTAAKIDDNLELHHDAVHRWVAAPNGHMADLYLSAMDPVFFLLHCHIDYLWEKFRERQKTLEIDSSEDYPKTNSTLHAPNRKMDNLNTSMTNKEGYSNRFTSEIYRYADSPSCANGCGRRNEFLYCNKRINACVSRSRDEFTDNDGFSKVKYRYTEEGKIPMDPPLKKDISGPTVFLPPQNITASNSKSPSGTKPFLESIIDPRTLGKGRKRRFVRGEKKENRLDIGFDINSLTLNKGIYPENMKDNFVMSPVMITVMSDKFLSNQATSKDFLRQRTNYTINIDTFGLSYVGYFGDWINFDGRIKNSESLEMMAFEKPTVNTKSVYVRVYDTEGNICQPTCLIAGSDYQECSGALKITPDYPLMYYDKSTEDGRQSAMPFLNFHCVR